MLPQESIAVMLLAAGSGTRLGAGVPKALVKLDHRSILQHAALGVAAWSSSAELIVVAPVGHEHTIAAQIEELRLANPTQIILGGNSRTESVRCGLSALNQQQWVLIHDCARALTPADLYDRLWAELSAGADAVLPVLPVVDTIKRASGNTIIESLDRSELVAAQTPQGFRTAALLDAYEQQAGDFTDDTALMAAAGYPVSSCLGAAEAMKITTPNDLRAARDLLTERERRMLPEMRIGQGSDVHAFDVEESELKLLGLSWPRERALSGHSDGDAALHAVVDALLSAAGLGDIGSNFGSDRPEYAAADSAIFVRESVRLVAEAGWEIENISVQILSNRPKIAPRREQAIERLRELLGTPNVSLSATTTDGLGFTGSGAGLEARAVVLLKRASASA